MFKKIFRKKNSEESIVLEKNNGDAKHDRYMRMMALADSNNDGVVTKEELNNYRLRWLQQNVIMDRTRDGVIDERDLGPNRAGEKTLKLMSNGSSAYPSELAKRGPMYRNAQSTFQQLNQR